MKNKIKTFFRKYWIVLSLIAAAIIIVGYFVNIIVFENKKDVLNILVLSSDINIEAMEEELYSLIEVNDDEEIVIKYMDSNGEADQAIILTWLRSRTVDVVIGEEDSIDFYARNGCLADMEELGIETDESDYYNAVDEYSSEGEIIGTGEQTLFGKYVKPITGLENMEKPIVAMAVNALNTENGMRILSYYMEIK